METEKLRPRWGTFSVIDHKNVGQLVPEILLYDRLVFPVPADDDERWNKKDWQPELMRQRVNELSEAGLAHAVKWTKTLRDDWAEGMEELGEVGNAIEGLGYDMTPAVLAVTDRLWKDRVPPPIPVAAFRNPQSAKLMYKVQALDPRRAAQQELNREVGALFERRLELPIVEEPKKTYYRAIELARSEDFQLARRSLFDWEDRRAKSGWPSEAAIKELEDLVDNHNGLVRSHFRKTWVRRVYHIVSFATGVGIEALGVPFLGLGVSGAMELVSAKFPILSKKGPDPKESPGAAPHMAISALAHDPAFG